MNAIATIPAVPNHEERDTFETATAADHAHHWMIEEAHGLTSHGVCKTCGATREFKNWLEESDFITNEEHRVAA